MNPRLLEKLPGEVEGSRNKRGRGLWFDRLVVAGIVSLVMFSPLAIGSVNPWAFSTVEAVIFLLTMIWMARLALENTPQAFPGLRSLLIPAALFVGLIIFQLIPLPSSVMRVLSPSTYQLYATSLPGWPEHDSYRDSSGSRSGAKARGQNYVWATLDSSPSIQNHKAEGSGRRQGWIDAISRWRPISIAPALTGSAALKLIAYGCLFFLVLFYPFPRYPRPLGERRFCRRLLKIILFTGLAVASIGLLQKAFWNGAILWLYVPYDWGQPQPAFDARALGPFVNPNHFAAYLNLILPLALACALFQTFVSQRGNARVSLRLLCFAAASILVSAIALSLSRGGWMGGFVAVSIVIWAAFMAHRRGQPGRGGFWWRMPGALYVVFGLCLIAGTALYTVPAAPTAVGGRLEATVAEPDFDSRLGYWRDSLALIRDFPMLGVGMGCFQDLFPRYQSPPWSPYAVREAHNDYLELAAGTGLAGVALLLWFFLTAASRIFRGLRTLRAEVFPVVVALVAGLCAMAFQELFDFALQIPANAVLFTILLAIAMRLCGAARGDGSDHHYTASTVRRFATGVGAAAIVLILAALRQDPTPYPYLPSLPGDAPAARALILAHPARSMPHLWYAATEQGSAAGQLRELAAAAALDPNNPLILDRYAQVLAAGGQTDAALAELRRSMFVYPSMEDHFYLQPGMIGWLSIEERKAIDAGFQMAIAHKFNGASPALAAFWAALHHDAAEAEVLAKASSAADQPAHRMELLFEAGAAYMRAGETERAANTLKEAIEVEPSNPKPYEFLLTQILAPQKDIDSARAVVQAGLKNNADPFLLYLSLAQVYEQLGDLRGAEAALLQAARLHPGDHYDYDTLMRLADLEMGAKHFDQAAFWMRQAVEVRPGSPAALYQLALAEENDYQYGPALRDLARALSLAPQDARMRNHYREMLHMIAAHSDHNRPPAAAAGKQAE